MSFQIIITLVAFVFIGYALMSGKLSGAIACGISVLVLWFCGVLSQQEVFANFVSDSILSLIAMMVLCKALMKTDILIHIASLVQKMRGGVVILLFSTMFITSLLVTFIGSQITAVITVIPLAMALAKAAGISPTILVYPAVIGAQCTLFPVPVGSASVMYMMHNQILESFGAVGDIGMWDSKWIAFVPSVAAMLFVMFGGWKLLPKRELGESSLLDKGGMEGLKKSELSKAKQGVIYVLFVGVLVLLMFAKDIGISAVQITMSGALLTIILGILNDREFFGSINWSLVFMMSFMLAFIAAVSNSGAGEYLAQLLSPIFKTGNIWLCTSVTFIFCVIATQFMDNMGLMNILWPIVTAAATANGMPATPIFLAVSASAVISYVTPMGSPAALLAFQLGGYKIKEMLKFAVPVVIITTIVACVWIPLYFTMFKGY